MQKYPEILNQSEILKYTCYKKLESKFPNCNDVIKNRMEYELRAIHETKMEDILLCLQKVVKSLNIKPYQIIHRGTTGSSLVVYLLGLTCINPIEYGLNSYLCYGRKGNYKKPNIKFNVDKNIKNKIIEELNKNNDYKSFTNYNKIDILSWEAIELLNVIEKITNTDSNAIKDDDKNVVEYINNDNAENIFKNIFCFDNQFVKNLCSILKPKCFNDLIKIISLSYGTNVWNDNFDELYNSGKVSINEILANRDDYFEILSKHGFSEDESFVIIENIRKGEGINIDNGDSYKKIFKTKGLPDWFYDSCNKVKYLLPKAHAVNYLMVIWKLIWYKIHFPKEYLKAYVQYN